MTVKSKIRKTLSVPAVCIIFVLLTFLSADAQTSGKIYVGDINLDGIVTAEDARIVLRKICGLSPGENNEITVSADSGENSDTASVVTADANLNGSLTLTDARLLLRISIGLTSFSSTFSEYYPTSISQNEGTGHTVTVTKHGTEYYAVEPCSFGAVKETVATCTETGTVYLKCTLCGKTETEKIPATGHEYSEKGTKTGNGTHYYKCIYGCGAKTAEEKCTYVKSVKTAACCGVKGTTLYKCSVCGYSYTKTDIPALKHKFTKYTSDGNATWLKDGTKTAKCDNPGCKGTKTVTDKGSKLDSSHIPSNVKVLYLTFDDGPSTYTDDILKILKEKGAKATWFVIHSSSYASCYKKIVDAGHAIGLHSYTHDYSKIYSSTTAFYSDLKKISDEVYKYTGVRSKLYRFPGGSSNTVSRYYCKGIMSSLTKSIQEKGYSYFDWNAQNNDATGVYYSADGLYKAAIASCGKNRVVMLMHDCGDKYNTVASLGKIIDYYKARGYYCLALDEKSETAHHGVAN